MNFEGRIEQFGKILINHRIKVILSTLIVIFAITFGMRFLETPSGYRGFVEEDFKYYQDGFRSRGKIWKHRRTYLRYKAK